MLLYKERTCNLPLSFELKANHVESFPKTQRKQILECYCFMTGIFQCLSISLLNDWHTPVSALVNRAYHILFADINQIWLLSWVTLINVMSKCFLKERLCGVISRCFWTLSFIPSDNASWLCLRQVIYANLWRQRFHWLRNDWRAFDNAKSFWIFFRHIECT